MSVSIKAHKGKKTLDSQHSEIWCLESGVAGMTQVLPW
jgi:hypothetical protein